MINVFKLLIAFSSYCIIAPLAGYIFGKYRWIRDLLAGILVFLTGLHIDRTVVMAGSIEWYRGVTKGYEFTMMECVAIALLAACFVSRNQTDRLPEQRRFNWLPAGSGLWFIYVFCSALSIFSAIQADLVLMSVVKFGKVWLIVWALANYVKGEREIQVIMRAVSVTILFQFLFVARMKWIDGIYQVSGLFEHQNPLAMYTYMAVLPLLSVALSPHTSKRDSVLYLAGYGAGAIILLAALSRASLVLFACGTAGVMAFALFDRPTVKRMGVLLLMAMGGFLVLLLTFDTIISRFHDEGNEASAETRDVMNLASVAMVQDKPLGVGWNNFGLAINHPYPYGDVIDDWNLERGQNVDEDYAKGVVESHYYLLLGETGYLGLMSYLIFIFAMLTRSIWLNMTFRRQLTGHLMAGINIAFVLTYFHSTLERVLTQTKNLALWMIFIGVISGIWANRKEIRRK